MIMPGFRAVERYIFTVHTSIVLGTPCDVVLKGEPMVEYRADYALCNLGTAFKPAKWIMAGKEQRVHIEKHIYGPMFAPEPFEEWPVMNIGSGVELHGRYDGDVAYGFTAGRECALAIAFTGFAKR